MFLPSICATVGILPAQVVSNEEIVERLIAGSGGDVGQSTLDHVRARARDLLRKTGLRERRFFGPAEEPVEAAYAALSRLLLRAGSPWSELDAIIVSSSSIHGFPGLSQQLVARARSEHPGLGNPFVLDIGSNACTGFMYGLGIARSLSMVQGYRRIACLAVEFASRCIAYHVDAFATSTLFGDAIAGVLIAPEGPAQVHLTSMHMGSWIDAQRIDHIRGGGLAASRMTLPPADHQRWFMSGPPVALGAIEILIAEVCRYKDAGVEVDWLIPHQANLTRILHPACDALGIPRQRLCASFEHTGNTSSASIPLLLDDLLSSGRARVGENLLLVGFGASYAVGSAHLSVA